MKSVIITFIFLIATFSFAQETAPSVEQDGVRFSFEYSKLRAEKKWDRYLAVLTAENMNNHDLYYTGRASTTGTYDVNPGFATLRLGNTTGFLSANTSVLKGPSTEHITSDNEPLFKIGKGEIITMDFKFKVKNDEKPVLFNRFTKSMKPLEYYRLKEKGISKPFPNANFPTELSDPTASTMLSRQVLNIDDCLSSENQQYFLQMQYDGNLCVYQRTGPNQNDFVWCSMSSGKGGTQLKLQKDGNLVIYTNRNEPVWSTSTMGYFDAKYRNSNYKPVRLKLENDGVLALYSVTGNRVWTNIDNTQPSYREIPKPFPQANFPTVRFDSSGKLLPANETLRINDCLSSENQVYYLVLQEDGNLCVYKRTEYGNHAFVWGTMTHGKGGQELRLQSDGNLVLYNSYNSPIWSTETMGYFDAKYYSSRYKPVSLILENDGSLSLYSSTGERSWNSGR